VKNKNYEVPQYAAVSILLIHLPTVQIFLAHCSWIPSSYALPLR